MNRRHGGNVHDLSRATGKAVEDILDFSANINPLGPPAWLPGLIKAHIGSLVHYPDPQCTDLVRTVAETYGLSRDEIVIGNGSSELLYIIPRVLGVRRALIPVPAYGDYALAAARAGLEVEKLPLREEEQFCLDLVALEARLRDGEVVFIGQPANPTGYACPPEALRGLAARHRRTKFIIDEAFADFLKDQDRLLFRRPSNVIVLCSLTKFYAIPGLRLGYAVADRDIAQRIGELVPTWSVNTLAQAAGEKALRDREYQERSRKTTQVLREELIDAVESMPGLTVYPGEANFLLVRVDRDDLDAPAIARELIAEGIAIRLYDNCEGLGERFFRIAVRRAEENERLCEALTRIFGVSATASFNPPPRGGRVRERVARPKPAVMFQGTCSNAGKSVLAAAMCRILLQDGYRVAPFKAQNMSLNSFVTPGGGEIGRAQAVQAQACRIEPDVRMNPLLLKPSPDTGSQVIVLGKPVGNMDFNQYTRHHEEYLAVARQAYNSLAAEYDVMVLEGAGSPAEVNLRRHDIANMKTALYARSPVLLVGNIDRGGVYASFVGTLELLSEADRALIAGFVVNRFRGTASLLGSAHDFILQRTGRPVLGVIPELLDLGLPEEDSVGFREGAVGGAVDDGEGVEIAVIDFAHISNFTDLDALRIEPDVRLRLVRSASDLGTPDAVIMPGSKNVIADLASLRSNGLGVRLLELAKAGGTEIVGLCGGFQMLGREIADPHGIESTGKTLPGLGLLPLTTVLQPEKLLKQTKAAHIASGLEVRGYEIHHGRTEGGDVLPVMEKADGELVGVGTDDGWVWGTYLHGVFDADLFRRWFIDRLRVRRGLLPLGTGAVYNLEPAFDRLAAAVRDNLDMNSIYQMMGLR